MSPKPSLSVPCRVRTTKGKFDDILDPDKGNYEDSRQFPCSWAMGLWNSPKLLLISHNETSAFTSYITGILPQ